MRSCPAKSASCGGVRTGTPPRVNRSSVGLRSISVTSVFRRRSHLLTFRASRTHRCRPRARHHTPVEVPEVGIA
jgi:hypothetical protein